MFERKQRELKQRWRRRHRERQKNNRSRLAKQQVCTCITLLCTFLCSRLHDYDVKMPNFTICWEREHKTTTFLFFSWTSIQSFRIQLEKNIANIWRINWDGLSAIKFEAAQIHFNFKWCFCRRRRRCCLNSISTRRTEASLLISTEVKSVTAIV